MKIVAIMPIKLKNKRLPGKNTMLLGNKPLLRHELDNLLQLEDIDSIYVYCSDKHIKDFLPEGVEFIKRPDYLDLDTSNFTQIFKEFMKVQDADIYVYAHATAPFVKIDTMKECIEAVKSGEFDSAFCAVRLQDYLWQSGKPLNFDASNLPRTQDLEPVYQETSGVYVFKKEVFKKYNRRIGIKPFIKEVSIKEAVDIDEAKDFNLAEMLLTVDI